MLDWLRRKVNPGRDKEDPLIARWGEPRLGSSRSPIPSGPRFGRSFSVGRDAFGETSGVQGFAPVSPSAPFASGLRGGSFTSGPEPFGPDTPGPGTQRAPAGYEYAFPNQVMPTPERGSVNPLIEPNPPALPGAGTQADAGVRGSVSPIVETPPPAGAAGVAADTR